MGVVGGLEMIPYNVFTDLTESVSLCDFPAIVQED